MLQMHVVTSASIPDAGVVQSRLRQQQLADIPSEHPQGTTQLLPAQQQPPAVVCFNSLQPLPPVLLPESSTIISDNGADEGISNAGGQALTYFQCLQVL